MLLRQPAALFLHGKLFRHQEGIMVSLAAALIY